MCRGIEIITSAGAKRLRRSSEKCILKSAGDPIGGGGRGGRAPCVRWSVYSPFGGVSRGSVRVGAKLFFYGFTAFLFGYKRKGVNIAALIGAERLVVGHIISRFCVNAITGRRYNPSVAPLKTERRASSPYTGEPRTLSAHLRAQLLIPNS